MVKSRDCVIELSGVSLYHNIDPFKELTSRSYQRNGEKVLSNVDLKVYSGELVYLIGRVGSGKSSLLKTLYGELPLFEGDGRVVGFDLRELKRRHISELRRNMGIVFQDVQMLSDRTVYENLAFVLCATGWKNEREIEARIASVLEQVGLKSRSDRMPFELSGGECQRLMIARALLNSPRLILADEPTGNLDPVTAESIVKLFHAIAAEGTAVLMATHNTAFVERFPARTLLFSKGEMREVDFS